MNIFLAGFFIITLFLIIAYYLAIREDIKNDVKWNLGKCVKDGCIGTWVFSDSRIDGFFAYKCTLCENEIMTTKKMDINK